MRPINKGSSIIFSNYRAGDLLLLDGVTPSDKLDEIEIKKCSLRLLRGEQCFYQGPGYSTESYEETVGYNHSIRGISHRHGRPFHPFNRFGFGHSSSAYSLNGTIKAVSRTVTNRYCGTLYITNERIVFLCENGKFNFDISLDDLSNVTLKDDSVTLYSGMDSFCVFNDDCIFIRDLIVLMNMCYEDQQANETGTDSLSDISTLWNYGDEEMWKDSLEGYYDLLSESQLPLEQNMEEVNFEDIEALSVYQFYDFLYEWYFVWKYTQKNRLATTRKHLEKYITEDRMHELAEIQKRLFEADRDDIRECLSIASQIRGLGIAGASGLLSILFPSDFGTVDQFVVKSLLKVEGLREHDLLIGMKPESLTIDDGVILINIMRKQARRLNTHFDSEFWTPRKIDMILWSIER